MKEKISKELKRSVWIKENKDKNSTLCPCCGIYKIYSENFDCGHMTAEACGGQTILDNLIPICHKCNTSMGTTNYHIFKDILDGKLYTDNMPEMLKIKVWYKEYKHAGCGKCVCCDDVVLTINSFECGHIIPKRRGGRNTLSNLCPVCKECYKKVNKHGLHGAKKILNREYCCCWFV